MYGMMQLGQYLRDLRLRKRLTLMEVNRLSGVSTGYLSMLEKGDRSSPHPDILRKLAKVYGVSIQEIMEVAGYLGRGEDKVFSQKDEIEWAIATILRDPTHGSTFDKVRVKSMSLEMKLKVIRAYEAMTGKKLLS
jgi:transcriptional regulator with XRE-family HTH domain